MATISRRSVARGAVWSAPILALAGQAPSFAASGTLRLVHTANPGLSGCPATTGISDVYYYLTIKNDSGVPITLSAPLVITLTSTNVNRSRLGASSSYGSVSNSGSTAVWTLPAGTVIPANSDVDLVWHFLTDLGDPTSVTATTTNPLILNRTSNSVSGYNNGRCSGLF